MIVRFNLDRRFRRPVINVMNKGKIYPALIDTGAAVPVFTLGVNKISAFDGRLCRENVSFTGFGGVCRGNYYRINLELGILKYIDLPVICVHDSEMPFAFIFSATMFTGFSYTIDDARHIFTIDTMTGGRELRLRIRDKTGGFRILAISEDNGIDARYEPHSRLL